MPLGELNRAEADTRAGRFQVALWDNGPEGGFNLTLNYYVDDMNFGCGHFEMNDYVQIKELYEMLRETLLMSEVTGGADAI